MLFGEAQMEPEKPWYPLNVGAPPALRMNVSALRSSSPVVTPGSTASRSSASVCATIAPEAAIRSISRRDLRITMAGQCSRPQELDRRLQRAHLPGRIGRPAPRDVEGRAVLGGRAQGRQPERAADGSEEADGLGRDVALVVVERDDRVVLALPPLPEHRVGRDRPAHVQAGAAGRLDRGLQLALLLVAVEAAV